MIMRNNVDTVRYSALSSKKIITFVRSPRNSLARKLREKLAALCSFLLVSTSKTTGFRKSTFQVILHIRTLSLDNLKLSLMANERYRCNAKHLAEIDDTNFDRSDHRLHMEIFVYRW